MSDPKPVLSEEQATALCIEFHPDGHRCTHSSVRAVERAVLEALPSLPISQAFDKIIRPIDDENTALRAFHSRAIGILGAHGALDQGVEVDALTWLADVLTQAAALRARVAELERVVEEGSNEIGEVMRVNERLAKERDAARRELEEARVQREMLVERLVSVRMTDWLKKRDGNFTNAESIEAERATREGVENWLRKDHAALDRAREEKP